MTGTPDRFSTLQRTLHWLMAAMVLAMLFIGIGMVSTVAPRYGTLVAIHKPLGISILLLVLIRLGVRLWKGAPALPADLPGWQAEAAKASHLLLYALMILMPLIGWSMLSAGGYPIRALERCPAAPHHAPQRHAARDPPRRPHLARFFVLHHDPGPPRGRALPWPGAPRRRSLDHAAPPSGEARRALAHHGTGGRHGPPCAKRSRNITGRSAGATQSLSCPKRGRGQP